MPVGGFGPEIGRMPETGRGLENWRTLKRGYSRQQNEREADTRHNEKSEEGVLIYKSSRSPCKLGSDYDKQPKLASGLAGLRLVFRDSRLSGLASGSCHDCGGEDIGQRMAAQEECWILTFRCVDV